MPKATGIYENAVLHENTSSMYFLAKIYEIGEGRPIDITQAIMLYSLASKATPSILNNQDNESVRNARNKLARLQAAHPKEALAADNLEKTSPYPFLLERASKGDANAQFQVADFYYHKLKNKAAALNWFLKAAENNHIGAAQAVYDMSNPQGDMPNAELAAEALKRLSAHK